MDGIINLGIELYRDTLRYAKVERKDDTWQLIRLGSYVFDFDIAAVMLGNESNPNALQIIRSAMLDMLEQNPIQEMRITLHPSQAHHFYVPVEVNLSSVERAQHFLRDARMVTGEANTPLHIVPHSLFLEELSNQEQVAWYQISVIPKSTYRQFAQYIKGMNIAQYHICSVETSVSKVITEIVSPQAMRKQAPFVMALGNYAHHTEFLLCRSENLHFSNYSESTTPEKSVEHIQQIMERLHFIPQMLGKMYVYGTELDQDWDLHAETFGMVPEVITPALVPKLYSQNLEDSSVLSAYIPAIGAAM